MNYGDTPTGILIGVAEEEARSSGLLQGLMPGANGYFGSAYGRIYKEETGYRRPIARDALAAGRARRRIEDIKQASHLEALWADPWDD